MIKKKKKAKEATLKKDLSTKMRSSNSALKEPETWTSYIFESHICPQIKFLEDLSKIANKICSEEFIDNIKRIVMYKLLW